MNPFAASLSPIAQPLLDSKKKSNSIKFNRKQDPPKENNIRKQDFLKDNRKQLELFRDVAQRICFVSPPKITNSPHHSDIDNAVLPRQQSCILGSQIRQEERMDDSILSLMQELNGESEKRHENETQQYLQMIQSLGEEIDELQKENRRLKKHNFQLQQLQEFLIEREGYISEVTERNINLNEQLQQLHLQKEVLSNEMRQLQLDYANQQRMYEAYISKLKQQKDSQITSVVQKPQLTMKKLRRARDKSVTERSILEGTIQTKETDLSMVKSMDEMTILQKMGQVEDCDCRHENKKLQQRIRYNEIEIDVLKRTKANTAKMSQENERLRALNKKLRVKLAKGKHLDSSLQISLSPKKN